MLNEELYMHRCLELAKLGSGNVAPNPMVGAVLVNGDRIIGEGYHKQYGQPHAEVNCIESVSAEDQHLIPASTLFVSLEPCAHFGKTPPCADLILSSNIKRVVVGCVDPFSKVNGKGIEKLINAGVDVQMGLLNTESIDLNKRFFTYHNLKRPYIVLKWAQSANQQIANADRTRVLISNEYTNRLVHKWRSAEAGIMVGTNTALTDNPSLNTRLWHGSDPTRLIFDLNLRLPTDLNIYNRQQQTIIFNKLKDSVEENLIYIKLEEAGEVIQQVLNACYKKGIQSILVEGGAMLLQSFIEKKAWDEARVIQNNKLIIPNGIAAPVLQNQGLSSIEEISSDTIFYYESTAHQ
jgi:diaminohydroxyphosphoribosylaminopyrimidine deaminase/5-amino-6-(5-phosphoribosylamino)uracil reductase